ncbi:MAG TPA: hypothetical protein VF534_01530 [Paraburkholderia sp.]
MSITPGAREFVVDVPDVGVFTFARRNMRSELAISAEFSRLSEGIATPSAFLETVGGWIATLKVLTLIAPDGWVLDELDPLDDENYARLMKVHGALRAREDSFRQKPKPGSEDQRTGRGADDSVLVPSQVQPGAD